MYYHHLLSFQIRLRPHARQSPHLSHLLLYAHPCTCSSSPHEFLCIYTCPLSSVLCQIVLCVLPSFPAICMLTINLITLCLDLELYLGFRFLCLPLVGFV